MKRFGRRDRKHAEIRDGLRERGVRVIDNASKGDDEPDLIACAGIGIPVLLEVKSADGELTKGQRAFLLAWPGPAAVVETLAEAWAAVRSPRRFTVWRRSDGRVF